MPLVIFTGGVRSGKSAAVVKRALAQNRRVHFIATAEPGDEEMRRRIEHHKAQRPDDWQTIEQPIELEDALRDVPSDDTVIVDCLTLWVTNLLLAGLSDDEIERRAVLARDICEGRSGTTLVVTNEVGSSVHPESALGRRFGDLMGRTNSLWASHADEAVLMVMGRAVDLSGP